VLRQTTIRTLTLARGARRPTAIRAIPLPEQPGFHLNKGTWSALEAARTSRGAMISMTALTTTGVEHRVSPLPRRYPAATCRSLRHVPSQTSHSARAAKRSLPEPGTPRAVAQTRHDSEMEQRREPATRSVLHSAAYVYCKCPSRSTTVARMTALDGMVTGQYSVTHAVREQAGGMRKQCGLIASRLPAPDSPRTVAIFASGHLHQRALHCGSTF